MSRCMLYAVLTLAAGLSGGCGFGSSGPPAPIPTADLKAATVHVLADFNSKRPAAVCSDASPQAAAWATSFAHTVFGARGSNLCAPFLAVYFHQTEDADGNVTAPEFARVSVARWLRVGMQGPYGRVAALIRVIYEKPVSSYLHQPHLVVFYFERLDGRLMLAALPPVGQAIQGTDAVPVLNLAPADAAVSTRPARIPPPAFPCDGPVQSAPDAANDVHFGDDSEDEHPMPAPWLDIRRVAVHGAAGAHPCVEIDFAAPIRPDTEIQFDGGDIAFGAHGDTAGFGFLPQPGTYGERGSRLYLSAVPGELADPFARMSACAVQNRGFDPLDFGTMEGSDGWAADPATLPSGGDPNQLCGAY